MRLRAFRSFTPNMHHGARLPLVALAACGAAALFIQCESFSADSGSDASSGGVTSTGPGGETAASSGGSGGGSPCLTIWEGCPPMDTALEPLHERQNGAGSLLLAQGAFWLQGSVVFRNPDGSRGEIFLGALRIPYEPGSTPRVLEG